MIIRNIYIFDRFHKELRQEQSSIECDIKELIDRKPSFSIRVYMTHIKQETSTRVYLCDLFRHVSFMPPYQINKSLWDKMKKSKYTSFSLFFFLKKK